MESLELETYGRLKKKKDNKTMKFENDLHPDRLRQSSHI